MPAKIRVLLTAVLVAAALSACSTAVSNASLKVGDCTNPQNSTDADGNSVVGTVVVPCAQPHAEEVFSVFDYPNATASTAFPGYEAIGAIEQTRCEGDFTDYVGISWEQSASYSIDYAGPTEQTWAAGDRAIVCSLASATGADMVGSAKDSAR